MVHPMPNNYNRNKRPKNSLENQRESSYLGGLFSRKSWTWDKEGLNRDSLAAKASSKGTEPPIALAKPDIEESEM